MVYNQLSTYKIWVIRHSVKDYTNERLRDDTATQLQTHYIDI